VKALSIRQPWAWAILHVGKRVENRGWTWAPTWRGWFLLHAAKGCTRDEYEDAMDDVIDIRPDIAPPRLASLDRGAIVGRARLVAAHHASASPWAIPGALHLILADVEALATPIPFKGALGFFGVPYDVLVGARFEAVRP
jgi:hypothetical protein